MLKSHGALATVYREKNEALEMIKMRLPVVRIAAFCLPLTLVASCGSGTEAVQGTVINIDPTATAQTVPFGSPGTITNSRYRIELRSPSGEAQAGVTLLISSPWVLSAVDTSTVPTTFTPMGPAGTGYTVTTDNYGTYTVAVTYTSGLTPVGDVTILSVWSGTAYNRVNITYTCRATAPDVCPS